MPVGGARSVQETNEQSVDVSDVLRVYQAASNASADVDGANDTLGLPRGRTTSNSKTVWAFEV